MASLSMPASTYAELIAHLSSSKVEHVAFLFSEPPVPGKPLRVIEMYRVPRERFDFQSDYHVALTDEVRGHVIKRAHDLGGCLVEVHSHGGGPPVWFSGSDLRGFEDWVPHVRWRLRRRAYVALVFAGEAFDALVWEGEDNAPAPLASLEIDGHEAQSPSGITYERLRRHRP
jgi:Prokaryotic homologs of the JAB domain